jgi:hypothetical protein
MPEASLHHFTLVTVKTIYHVTVAERKASKPFVEQWWLL